MKPLFCTLILSFFFAYGWTQSRKSVDALRIEKPLVIDAVLDEDCYSVGIPAEDFFQLNPYNGQPAMQPSKVYFFYNDDALFVGAMLFDSAPDSIFNFLTERDELGMSDYFGVYIDPYNQGQLAYGFYITPSGVQLDMKATDTDHEEDDSWDAVWESAAKITEKGWVVEMKIPYSALRFPNVSEHTWGLNIFRRIRRYNSNNSWNHIRRDVAGFINQQGEMKGIRNIRPPVRLSLSPYAAGYVQMSGKPVEYDLIYKGGMDLKYGINESYTLDMMLIPDFGQVQSDDQELNLTPFELYYDEKRQFFTEGTEMFGRAGIFYSRRIGAAPKFSDRAEDALGEHEKIDFLPSETQLLNATKLSGRNSKGWGLGLLNAMSLPSFARLKDTISGETREINVQPFTNYNVALIDKSLKNNSYASLINTNVSMAGDPFFSNVTAVDFQLKNNKKTYALIGKGGISYRREEDAETGVGAGLELNRIKGKFMYGIEQTVFDDRININDLGYLRRNNLIQTNTWAMYNITEPFGIFNELRFRGRWEASYVYNPRDFVGHEFSAVVISTFRNFYTTGFFLGYQTDYKDYYEPHVKGRYFHSSGFAFADLFLMTDSRKPLRLEMDYTHYELTGREGNGDIVESELSLRVGQRLQFEYANHIENNYRNIGFVDMNASEDSIYFALRDIHVIENVLEAGYVINNRMGINLRARHYWSGAVNREYYLLNKDGGVGHAGDYQANHNQNYNAFSIDMRYRWIFAPGSELSLAWKNSIYDNTEYYYRDYFGNLKDTWSLGQTNSISLKVLYYLDYNTIRKN